MKIKMNKKAYWRIADIGMLFLSFIVIAVTIIIGMYVFYSNQVDVRYSEAEILAFKLINGIQNADYLKENFNIFESSGIDEKIINKNEFYFKLEILNGTSEIRSFQGGNNEFRVYCEIESEKFPRCFKKELIIDSYKIRILTASNQKGETF